MTTIASRWTEHRRIEMPIAETAQRLIVGSYGRRYDFYLSDAAEVTEPRPLHLGAQRPSIRELIDALREAGIRADLALKAVATVLTLDPTLIDEESAPDTQEALEATRDQEETHLAESA